MSAFHANKLANDMKAFDALGPLAREIVRIAPSEVWVLAVLNAWRQKHPEFMGLDEPCRLEDPAVDASVAKFVADAIRQKFGKPPEAFRVERTGRVRRC